MHSRQLARLNASRPSRHSSSPWRAALVALLLSAGAAGAIQTPAAQTAAASTQAAQAPPATAAVKPASQAGQAAQGEPLKLPVEDGSVKFLVIGDSGTGDR